MEALLSRIHGQSTPVPENLITPKYTSGALMGNGGIGVVAGDPLSLSRVSGLANQTSGARIGMHLVMLPLGVPRPKSLT